MLFDLIDYYYTFAHYNGIFVYLGQGQGKWKDFSIDKQTEWLIVAGWRVFGGLGLSCGGKNSLGRADFSWILEYLEEKSWESIGIKNFRSF